MTKEKISLEESLATKSDALEDLSKENCEKQDQLLTQQSQQSGLKLEYTMYFCVIFFVLFNICKIGVTHLI